VACLEFVGPKATKGVEEVVEVCRKPSERERDLEKVS
jgi:hypothetical protein